MAKHRMTANGRTSTSRYVRLEHHLLRSPAWKSMGPAAKALLIDVWERHNGWNNSTISYSVREAAVIGLGRSTAAKAFTELIERGFLKVGTASSFNLKTKMARTWVLTAEPVGGARPTKDFMRWKAVPVTKSKTRSAHAETQSVLPDNKPIRAMKVPTSVRPAGPSEAMCSVSRSTEADTYRYTIGVDHQQGTPSGLSIQPEPSERPPDKPAKRAKQGAEASFDASHQHYDPSKTSAILDHKKLAIAVSSKLDADGRTQQQMATRLGVGEDSLRAWLDGRSSLMPATVALLREYAENKPLPRQILLWDFISGGL